MVSARITSLPELIDTIGRRACLKDPDDICGSPLARTKVKDAGLEEQHVHGLDWADVVVSASRFTATTIEKAHFQRVIFQDCDLSGLTFVDSTLRDCVFADVKSRAQMNFTNTRIEGVFMTEILLDHLEFQQSKIGSVTIAGGECQTLSFHHCAPMNRYSGLTLTQLNLKSVGGLTELRKSGVAVQVDGDLWRSLGDMYLRQQGLDEIEGDKLDDLSLAVAGAAARLNLPQPPLG